MNIKTKSLMDALGSLQPITRGRTTIPILSSVLIRAVGGRFSITATNLDCWSGRELECDGDLDALCVRLDYLLASIGTSETTSLEIQSGKLSIMPSGIKLATLSAVEFPDVPKQKNASSIGVHTGDLADAIDAVSWACSRDRIGMQCVQCVGSGRKIETTATDSKTMAFVEKPSIAAEFNFLVLHKIATEFTSALRSVESDLKICPESLFVKHADGFFWCKQAEGTYPDTQSIKKMKKSQIGEIKVSDVIPVLKSGVRVFNVPQKFPAASLSFSPSSLRITSTSENILDRTIAGEFKTSEMRLDMSRLLECLESLKAEKATLFSFEKGLVIQSGDLAIMICKIIETN